MHELKDMLWQKVREYERKGDVSATDLDHLHKFVGTLEKLCKLEESESYGRHYVRGHYSRGMYDEMQNRMSDPRMSYGDKETLRKAMEILG